MPLSFRDYIKRRRVTDTPAGDFVRDAKDDHGLPDAKSWDQLHTYLVTRGAIGPAIEAARSVWGGYLAAKRREAN